MAYDVYGVGNALVDIQAQVSDATLAKTGFDKGIMTLVDDAKQQEVLASLDGVKTNRCAGGSAANTIMGIADFGGTPAYAGKVGQNEIGEFFLRDMRNMGVAIEVPQSADGSTGTCVVLITEDAERTMLTHLGVSATLGPDDIDEEEIKKAQYIYVEGYLFTGDSTKAAAYKAIELAVKNNVKVAFTVSDPFLIGMCKDEFWELIKGPVDLLFCNEEEAQALTGKTDNVACAQAIHEHAANVAMTLGADGSLVVHGGEVIPIEGVEVKAIDTTGAGDMYAAGLLYGITHGHSWKESGKVASAAAARIVSQMGARLQYPLSQEDIATLVQG
ncbi:UNVERIFIED_CONTAM: hypothetical protein GTU68_008721 [Idotea baltica]|nr:hypothetical protein [Idotea baltica]